LHDTSDLIDFHAKITTRKSPFCNGGYCNGTKFVEIGGIFCHGIKKWLQYVDVIATKLLRCDNFNFGCKRLVLLLPLF